jgi:hypothetical protein
MDEDTCNTLSTFSLKLLLSCPIAGGVAGVFDGLAQSGRDSVLATIHVILAALFPW